jgi:hypothetical protein
LEARHGHWAEAVRDIEKARELDPKGPNIPNGLTGFYNGLRDYVKSDQVADAAIAAFPNGPGYFIAAKVENALSRGDTEAGRAILATFPKDWDPSGYRSLLKIQVAFAARDFAEASHLIETVNKDNLIPPIARDISFIEALIARKQGNFTKSESILLPLRATWEAKLREKPDDSKLLGNLALIDAYLGHKEDAVREAEKAVELKPISRDAEYGPRRAAVLAQVCMLAGDHERAIQLLSELATIPWGPSYGELLTPWWDDLRGDPRFEKIVASLKPKPAQ